MTVEFLSWLLLGAAIGYVAAQKKGFSTVGGLLAGAALGPFAFLMFFVSGIGSASEQQRKCPYCAEWIRPEATVCKHCHKDVPPVEVVAQGMSWLLKGALIVLALFLGLIVIAVVMSSR